MSTLKNVANKLFKVELESHKVDLALVDDLKADLKALFDNGSKKANELSSIASSLQSGKTVAFQIVEKSKKAIAMAKELGLNTNDFDFVLKEADNYAKVLDAAAKNAIKYNSEL
jgi:hypothetical protein